MCAGVAYPSRLRYVPVIFANPALGKSFLNSTSSGNPGPPIATITGAYIQLLVQTPMPRCRWLIPWISQANTNIQQAMRLSPCLG